MKSRKRPAARTHRGNRKAKPVDFSVGCRLREARLAAGMSQNTLAAELKVTFQQIQKYEAAANRLSASRLYAIAKLLGRDIAWFFPADDDAPPDKFAGRRRPTSPT
jgi:transcriptional regulator with XRE-family HTH domain